ncbi:hypothetical protein PAT3040_02540, partial [Paenibacillus agaridevorans]
QGDGQGDPLRQNIRTPQARRCSRDLRFDGSAAAGGGLQAGDANRGGPAALRGLVRGVLWGE